MPVKKQVYVIMFDANGNFLLAKKNVKGYFFKGKNGKPDTIYKNGIAIKNGADKYALPGGALEGNEEYVNAALREFREETGNSVGMVQWREETKDPIDGGTKDRVAYQYKGQYCRSSDINKLKGQIDASLQQAKSAVADIRSGKITQYAKIKQAYTICPADDELETVMIWNIKNDWANIQKFNQDNDLQWYYTLLLYLKTDILKIP